MGLGSYGDNVLTPFLFSNNSNLLPMKFKFLISLISTVFLLQFLTACKKTEVVVTSPTVASLLCANATFSSNATASAVYTGTATVPYTGGNGSVAYTAGSTIASTGVTGLNATLQAGDLASGAGSLTYIVSGTSSGAGVANFAISFGGQSCTLALTVDKAATAIDCSTATGLQKIVCLAEAFKATLGTTQLAALQLTYTKANAVNWSNLPQALVQTKRVGVAFSTFNPTQLAAAKALLAAALGTSSNEGYAEAIAVLAADDYLSANGGGSTYGSGNYYMAFLGTPSTTGLWELQYGGHHYGVSNTYNGGKLTGATPSFRGVEPFAPFSLNNVNYEPIGQERIAFSAMLNGLSNTELTSAKLTTTFTDLLLGPGKDGQFPTAKSGLKISTLSSAQKALVLDAIKTYVNDQDDANAAIILAKYTSELDDTYLAYSGTTAVDTKNDYVRIDGPNIWIEYSCQGGIVIKTANHPHSVWRDRNGDYGGN
jgi:hypothetical protein